MDNWLYRVLKDAMALHTVTDDQAKTLLGRLMDALFANAHQRAPDSKE